MVARKADYWAEPMAAHLAAMLEGHLVANWAASLAVKKVALKVLRRAGTTAVHSVVQTAAAWVAN